MLFHVSIEADHPAHVAAVIAELWGGKALPFPPVANGSWVAFAGDARAPLIEVYSRGTELHQATGDAVGLPGSFRQHNATHVAMATALGEAEVLAIAAREGWPAKRCVRGGQFGVIEMWIEGAQMVEVLTPEMQAQYLATTTIEQWERMLAEAPSLAA